jgi:hypothetical protein
LPPEGARAELARSFRMMLDSTGRSRNARMDRRDMTASLTFINGSLSG